MAVFRSEGPVGRLWVAVFAGYLALGATIQEMPTFVVRRFDGGPLLSGTAVGVAFLATALCRPFAGLLADSGRARPVVVLGGMGTALGGIGHLVAPDPAVLLVSRLVMGAGEAALFSGALPWVLRGVDPERRGRVAGWFGLSMWGGLSLGPVLAAVVDAGHGYRGVWWTVTGLGLVSAAISAATGRVRDARVAVPWPRAVSDVVPPAVALPGVVIGLAAYGYGTVSALAVLYLRHLGTGGPAVVLPVFAAAFLVVRFAGSPLVDRLGGVRVAIGSLTVESVGLLLAGVLAREPTVLAGALLTGAGLALIYPAVVAITLRRTPRQPGVAVGAVTSFWDLGILVAGPLGGALAAEFAYPVSFVLAAVVGAAAVVLALARLRWPNSVDPAAEDVRVEV